jgi:hypothetical protein
MLDLQKSSRRGAFSSLRKRASFSRTLRLRGLPSCGDRQLRGRLWPAELSYAVSDWPSDADRAPHVRANRDAIDDIREQRGDRHVANVR